MRRRSDTKPEDLLKRQQSEAKLKILHQHGVTTCVDGDKIYAADFYSPSPGVFEGRVTNVTDMLIIDLWKWLGY